MKLPLSSLLIALLICATCIAPGMADAPTYVTEDGVHLLKFDNSPTKLDPKIYLLDPAEDVVIDDNQFYWIRIGTVETKKLTTVWWGPSCILGFGTFVGYMSFLLVIFASRRFFPLFYTRLMTPPHIQGKWKFATGWGVVSAIVAVMVIAIATGPINNTLTHTIDHIICDGYVDLKASDGTILFPVNKTHPESNPLFARSGLNLSTMTHLSSSGKILNPSPWSGSIHDLGIVIL